MRPLYEALGPEGMGTYLVDWNAYPPIFERVHHKAEVLLIPGLVDLHFHGAFGIDFMDPHPSALLGEPAEDKEVLSKERAQKALLTLCHRLEGEGYEGFLPTSVTASYQAVRSAVEALPQHPLILGFHLEGPFISPEFPGAQPNEAIVDPPIGASEWDALLDHPQLKIVTLAPERPGALELILRLQKRGVIVSMGHSNATYEEARRGFEFGANHVTHTFNAMRGFHHREAGITGYALTNLDLVCELIYDKKHVAKEAAQLLLKNKPSDKVIAVSDSTQATGLPPGLELEMWGQHCTTGKKEIRLTENGALAGSAVTLLDAFQNLAEDFDTETAIRLCCINPRKALGLTQPVQTYIELNQHMEIIRRHILSKKRDN